MTESMVRESEVIAAIRACGKTHDRVSLSHIVIWLRGQRPAAFIGDRTVDRALQRARRQGRIAWSSSTGWLEKIEKK